MLRCGTIRFYNNIIYYPLCRDQHRYAALRSTVSTGGGGKVPTRDPPTRCVGGLDTRSRRRSHRAARATKRTTEQPVPLQSPAVVVFAVRRAVTGTAEIACRHYVRFLSTADRPTDRTPEHRPQNARSAADVLSIAAQSSSFVFLASRVPYVVFSFLFIRQVTVRFRK